MRLACVRVERRTWATYGRVVQRFIQNINAPGHRELMRRTHASGQKCDIDRHEPCLCLVSILGRLSVEDSNGENASPPNFDRATSSSSQQSPSLVWSESPNLRFQLGLSSNIRPVVGLYGHGNKKKHVDAVDGCVVDGPAALYPRPGEFGCAPRQPAIPLPLDRTRSQLEWARQSKAEADARKKAKGAMISGFANMFKL